ncbi:hypothetical protein [Paractinoplanes globisporus]|uniref:Uncharacterized protein n=1 Tax=Paractinoplanes globisporus TaxID=113565 RepID=A0ABW6WW76_9ACTN|nr:hypothetical protein [Actinoplanes globisporus]
MFDNRNGWASAAQAIAAAIVALGFLALIGLIFWRATGPGQNFAEIWASTAALLGVAIGTIPTYFFQRQVRAERARSAVLGDRLSGWPPPRDGNDGA